MKRTFTFVVEFRGGTYCSQIQAKNINLSLIAWINNISKEKNNIEHLGDKTIQELKKLITNKDYWPIQLSGLKNIWHTTLSTKQGVFFINIILTDVSNASG